MHELSGLLHKSDTFFMESFCETLCCSGGKIAFSLQKMLIFSAIIQK